MEKKFFEFRKKIIMSFIAQKEEELAKAKEELAKLEEASKSEEQPKK